MCSRQRPAGRPARASAAVGVPDGFRRQRDARGRAGGALLAGASAATVGRELLQAQGRVQRGQGARMHTLCAAVSLSCNSVQRCAMQTECAARTGTSSDTHQGSQGQDGGPPGVQVDLAQVRNGGVPRVGACALRGRRMGQREGRRGPPTSGKVATATASVAVQLQSGIGPAPSGHQPRSPPCLTT